MKYLFVVLFTVYNMFTLTTIYPQNMLINCRSYIQEENQIVDKVIREKGTKLVVDLILPYVKGIDSLNSEIEKYTNSWLGEIRKSAEENFITNVPPMFPYEAYARYTVGRNDSKIVSFFIDYYEFLGGAHGITNRIAYTYSKDVGKKVALEELFKKGFNYKDVINKEIRRQIELDIDTYFEGGSYFKGVDEKSKFYLTKEGVVIYFNQYEIAPYAAGIRTFTIDYSLLKDNLLYGKI